MLDYHCQELSYEVIFHAINPRKQEVIFEDRTVTVETVPLKHKVPTCGFLFTEHHRKKNAETGEFYQESTKRYAYISDTMYTEKIIPQLEGVAMLFHESTYTEEYADRCRGTMHSTAKQAATIAHAAHAKSLLIGHFSARVDDHGQFLREAQEVFPNAQLAVERETIEF
jgi:ribonuclease Z